MYEVETNYSHLIKRRLKNLRRNKYSKLAYLSLSMTLPKLLLNNFPSVAFLTNAIVSNVMILGL